MSSTCSLVEAQYNGAQPFSSGSLILSGANSAMNLRSTRHFFSLPYVHSSGSTHVSDVLVVVADRTFAAALQLALILARSICLTWISTCCTRNYQYTNCSRPESAHRMQLGAVRYNHFLTQHLALEVQLHEMMKFFGDTALCCHPPLQITNGAFGLDLLREVVD